MTPDSAPQRWHKARALEGTFHQAQLVPASQSSPQALKKGLPHQVMWDLRMLQFLLRLPPTTLKKTFSR